VSTSTLIGNRRPGNLYGTSVLGGDFGSGTVFQLTLPETPDHHRALQLPRWRRRRRTLQGVTLDSQGNLRTAVTGSGGSCEGGCGVAYKLTNSGGVWNPDRDHTFTGGLTDTDRAPA